MVCSWLKSAGLTFVSPADLPLLRMACRHIPAVPVPAAPLAGALLMTISAL